MAENITATLISGGITLLVCILNSKVQTKKISAPAYEIISLTDCQPTQCIKADKYRAAETTDHLEQKMIPHKQKAES